jgi:hypothetical protein
MHIGTFPCLSTARPCCTGLFLAAFQGPCPAPVKTGEMSYCPVPIDHSFSQIIHSACLGTLHCGVVDCSRVDSMLPRDIAYDKKQFPPGMCWRSRLMHHVVSIVCDPVPSHHHQCGQPPHAPRAVPLLRSRASRPLDVHALSSTNVLMHNPMLLVPRPSN